MNVMDYWPWAGSLVGFLCLGGAMVSNSRKRLLQDLPTCKTTGVFIGMVELKGTAESESPFISYLALAPCVYYQWQVQEHWTRTVTEQYTDSEGKSQMRTRVESGWATVDSGYQLAPFYLKDDCGIIRIQPQGAKLETTGLFFKECSRVDELYYLKGPAAAVPDSDHRRRFVEKGIPLHHPVYIVGQSRLREDVVAPEIAAEESSQLFLISTRDESEVCRGYGWGMYLWWLLGLFLCTIGWTGWVSSTGYKTNFNPWAPLICAVVAYFAATAIGWVWTVYNSLVRLRQRVRQGRSQIDVQLRRRHDLIPQLVATVKGASGNESAVQETVAKLRSQLIATGTAIDAPRLEGTATAIATLAENYPQLKTNESFLKLQQELVSTENRVALARGYFNEVATYYNTRLQIVPDRFVAALAQMQREPLMAEPAFSPAPVHVNLSK